MRTGLGPDNGCGQSSLAAKQNSEFGPPVVTPLPMNQSLMANAEVANNKAAESPVTRELRGLSDLTFQWLNLMLVFVPLGIASYHLKWSSAHVFFLNFLAIVPLASILGQATESLAIHVGQMIGGLLNATFGNAVEMIVTIQALRRNMVRVVQGNLLGSVLSNLLLVLGMAFFAGGLRYSEQKFNSGGAGTNISCLMVASIAMVLPTIFNHMHNTTPQDVLMISRISSVLLSIIYALFIFFQLFTHKELFDSEEEEEEETDLSAFTAGWILFVSTLVIAYCSEYLVDSIEEVTLEYQIPEAFIGVILLPIVGNAAEHASAVTVAAKNKMDLCLGVAVGSSTQIALFAVPFAVLAGWILNTPMTLDFRFFDAAVMCLTVLLISGVLQGGTSNWLQGVMLMATYTLIAVVIWYLPAEGDDDRLRVLYEL